MLEENHALPEGPGDVSDGRQDDALFPREVEAEDDKAPSGDDNQHEGRVQAFRRALPRNPDRSSFEVSVLHEAKPDPGEEPTAEASSRNGGSGTHTSHFTSHMDKALLEATRPDEENGQTDFKSLVADNSLSSQDVSESQQFGSGSQEFASLRGSESLGRETSKLSETARGHEQRHNSGSRAGVLSFLTDFLTGEKLKAVA